MLIKNIIYENKRMKLITAFSLESIVFNLCLFLLFLPEMPHNYFLNSVCFFTLPTTLLVKSKKSFQASVIH